MFTAQATLFTSTTGHPPAIVSPGTMSPDKIGETHSVAGWAYSGEDLTASYQWTRGGQNIPGFTGETYVSQHEDNRKLLARRVTVSNPSGSVVDATPGVLMSYYSPVGLGSVGPLTANTESPPTVLDLSSMFSVQHDPTLLSIDSYTLGADGGVEVFGVDVFELGVFEAQGVIPPGLTIDLAAHTLTIDWAVVGVYEGVFFVIANNSGGSDRVYVELECVLAPPALEAPRLILDFPDYTAQVSDPDTIVDLTQHFEVTDDPDLQSVTSYEVNGAVPISGVSFDYAKAEMTFDWSVVGVYDGTLSIVAENAAGQATDQFRVTASADTVDDVKAIEGGVRVTSLAPGRELTVTAIENGVRIDYA